MERGKRSPTKRGAKSLWKIITWPAPRQLYVLSSFSLWGAGYLDLSIPHFWCHPVSGRGGKFPFPHLKLLLSSRKGAQQGVSALLDLLVALGVTGADS
jgi:hypothetical protein